MKTNTSQVFTSRNRFPLVKLLIDINIGAYKRRVIIEQIEGGNLGCPGEFRFRRRCGFWGNRHGQPKEEHCMGQEQGAQQTFKMLCSHSKIFCHYLKSSGFPEILFNTGDGL